LQAAAALIVIRSGVKAVQRGDYVMVEIPEGSEFFRVGGGGQYLGLCGAFCDQMLVFSLEVLA